MVMDSISRSSRGGQARRIFVDKIVLLASSITDFQLSLGQIAVGEAAGRKISTSKSETEVLSQKRVDHPLQCKGRPKRKG